MFFASDNAGPGHPAIMDAMVAANDGYAMPYGADPIMDRVRDKVRAAFEAPEAAVYLVATGTTANVLALATLCQPWQTVFCSPVAHIHEDECNSPEFYTGGAKLTLVPGGDKMTPEALRAAILAEEVRGVHGPQRGPVSITQVTERGGVYTLDELAALTAVAKEYGLPVHLDGARFANGLVALGCSPAEMTWKLGVDAVSFGGTKNGCPGVEAVVFFDPDKAMEFEYRRKRGGHLFSKHRYLSAQMDAYLTDGLWLDLARAANAAAARLRDGLADLPGVAIHGDPQGNMMFVDMPRAMHQRLKEAGAVYYIWGEDGPGDPDEIQMGRLVCNWATTEAEVDRFVAVAKG